MGSFRILMEDRPGMVGTHYDPTRPTSNHWHISDYNAADLNSTENNLAMYCGDEAYPACSNDDVDGGYGNSWNDILQFN